MLLAATVPIISAKTTNDSTSSVVQQDCIARRRVFTTCYIEATGSVNHMLKHLWFRPFLNDYAVVSYWAILFDEPDAQVTIYNRENGRVLWQDNEDFGQWGLKIIGYFGIYTNPSDEGLRINLRGNAICAITITE